MFTIDHISVLVLFLKCNFGFLCVVCVRLLLALALPPELVLLCYGLTYCAILKLIERLFSHVLLKKTLSYACWVEKKLWNNLKNLPWFWAHHGTSHTVFFPSIFSSDWQKNEIIFVLDFVTHNLNSYESLLGSRNLNESFFLHLNGDVSNSLFYTRESQRGSLDFFFCWPLSHDFLIKSLKAFGDEATPKTSQILVNLSLTFHKQITKDTQIPICTCTYYLSVQKWDFEVHKKNRNDSKAENFQRREDWFRALEQERKCVKVWC